MSQYDMLPRYDAADNDQRPAAMGLRIEGLVAQPRVLHDADLAALPRRTLVEPFTCEEGWTVPRVAWQGIPLSQVLALSQPAPEARYVRVCAGAYTIVLALAEAAESLLCDTLDGQPLTREHGAPWRLVVPGGKCFTSVKWVDRLEVTAEAGDSSGERIARARIR